MASEHVVCGTGEVGSALVEILAADGHDPSRGAEAKEGRYKYLHIAFPYSDSFVDAVTSYQARFTPEITIVHSSVPLGTTEKVKGVHSPIRGVHPHLAEGIRTLVKFFGGPEAEQAAKPFRDAGITCITSPNSKDAEAMKLWDLGQYGALIMLEKEIHAYCKEHGLDFEFVYRQANKTYNEGYVKLGREEVVRPYLKHVDGKIGGHCTIPVSEMLESETPKNVVQKNKLF